MRETLKTAAFAGAAMALALAAVLVEPAAVRPGIMSDQGEPFYPQFKDPAAVRTIEVVDYDEATATARPFQAKFQSGRWVLPGSNDYPVDVGDRLVKTAAALMDLRKDLVRSDSAMEHSEFGVIDPLDSKVASLTGRGKRVTLRDARNDVLADFILGKPVEGREGFRYLRTPGQKRTYAVKTDADPSARFADWVNAGILRIPTASIRRVAVMSYTLDEQMGRLANLENLTITREGGEWRVPGAARVNMAGVRGMAAALENLTIVDVRPKPATLARDLKTGSLELTLETAMSLRQRGFIVTPNGRLLANEGEMTVETGNGLAYTLRFGDIAPAGGDAKEAQENRFLFVTVAYDAARAAKYGDASGAGEQLARNLNARFADWYYVIRGSDFSRLRVKRKDVAVGAPAE
jgi:hypothetical protein